MDIDFNIESTVLFVKKRGKLWQIARFSLTGLKAPAVLRLVLDAGKWKRDYKLRAEERQENTFDLEIPEISKDIECRASLQLNKQKLEKTFLLKVHRKWDIHVQNFTHTDIGYTDLPSRVAEGYQEAFKSIISFCEETSNFDQYSKYMWNIETGYWLDKAIEGLDKNQLKKIKSLVHEKRIEITPLYVAHTSEFNDEETLIRRMYFAFYLHFVLQSKRESSIAAYITDTTWLLVPLLTRDVI